MADIGMLLKALWETESAAYQIRVGFLKGGMALFPAMMTTSLDENDEDAATYESSGCAWMVREINPFTKQHYGTRQDLATCAPSGFQVPVSQYNMMEADYCQDQIRNPF